MLGKLIKYEFKASGRLIPLVYLVVALLLAAGAILGAAKAYIFMAISFVMLFLAGAAAMIITYVIVFLRFHKGMFGAEGYLAMTLPVTSTQVYLSKTIVASCWMLLSTVVTVFSWIASFATLFRSVFEGVDIPSYAMQEMFEWYSMFFSPRITVFFVVGSIVGYLSFIAQVYFCVTIANVKPFQSLGVGAAIISFVVLQIVSQIVSSALMMFIPFGIAFDPYTGWSFSNASMWSTFSDYTNLGFTMGLGSYIPAVLFAFALPVLTIWLINHKVNLK